MILPRALRLRDEVIFLPRFYGTSSKRLVIARPAERAVAIQRDYFVARLAGLLVMTL